MGFLSMLFSFLGGGVVKDITGAIVNWSNTQLVKYQTGVNADVAVISKTVDAQVETNKIIAQMVAQDKGWWVTAWMKPSAFYICLCHFASVVFDTLPWFGHKVGSWGIPALPGIYATMEMSIILTCVGIVGLKGVARIFSGK